MRRSSPPSATRRATIRRSRTRSTSTAPPFPLAGAGRCSLPHSGQRFRPSELILDRRHTPRAQPVTFAPLCAPSAPNAPVTLAQCRQSVSQRHPAGCLATSTTPSPSPVQPDDIDESTTPQFGHALGTPNYNCNSTLHCPALSCERHLQ